MNKILLLALLVLVAACTSSPTAPAIPPQSPHVATYAVGVAVDNYQCSGSDVARFGVSWDVPVGTQWSARFLIQKPDQSHMMPAGYAYGEQAVKMTGCQYHIGDKAQAEVWISENGVTVRHATTEIIPVP